MTNFLIHVNNSLLLILGLICQGINNLIQTGRICKKSAVKKRINLKKKTCNKLTRPSDHVLYFKEEIPRSCNQEDPIYIKGAVVTLAIAVENGDLTASAAHFPASLASGLAVMMGILGEIILTFRNIGSSSSHKKKTLGLGDIGDILYT